jgi:hypothetical protein
MAIVPVFCDNCRTVFAASGFIAGDARGLSLKKARLGPCPSCGGKGRVPEGVYDFMGDAARALGDPAQPPEKLESLSRIIEEGRSKRASSQEIARDLEAEAPSLQPVTETLAEPERDGTRWIALLSTVVSVLQREPVSARDGDGDAEAERVTRTVVEELREHPAIAAPSERSEGGSAPPQGARQRTGKRKKQAKTFGQGKKRRR